jgi:hypothetical protein
MSVKEIEAAITKLSTKDVGALTEWLIEYNHQLWDKQIEDDLDAGRLDVVLEQVEKDYQAGLAKPL